MEEVFIYNRDHYRETQPNAVYHRVVNPNECIYKMPPLPTPKTQGTLLKRWQKNFKTQRIRLYHCVLVMS